MLLYYPELVRAIDNFKENARLDKITFSTDAPGQTHPVETREVAPPPLTGAAKTLDDAEKAYVNRDLEKAKNLFLASLAADRRQTAACRRLLRPGPHRAAAKRSGKRGEAVLKAKDLEPEPFVKGWVLVYLGKLSAASGDRSQPWSI